MEISHQIAMGFGIIGALALFVAAFVQCPGAAFVLLLLTVIAGPIGFAIGVVNWLYWLAEAHAVAQERADAIANASEGTAMRYMREKQQAREAKEARALQEQVKCE